MSATYEKEICEHKGNAPLDVNKAAVPLQSLYSSSTSAYPLQMSYAYGTDLMGAEAIDQAYQ